MAKGLYDKGRDKFSLADIDWVNDTVRAVLVDTSVYTVDLVNDEYLSDVPQSARIATVTLTGKSTAAGVVDANDTTFPNVTTGAAVGAVVIFKDIGIDNGSPLVHYNSEAAGLPITGDGDDVVIRWDDGTDKIFKL
jgi:hypothetical protein